MLLVMGATGVVLSSLFYGIVLLKCRNPEQSGWTNDFLVGNIYVPAIIILFVMGLGCVIQFALTISSRPTGRMEWILAIGVLGAGIALLKMLRIKKHLADYEKLEAAGKIIQAQVWTTPQADRPPESSPPVNPPAGKMVA